jgi:DNA repair exonuclease SbcCD ATPase subunit
VIKHRNHECLELKDADARFVGKIGAALEQLKPVCSKYQNDLQTLTTATETLKTNCNKLSSDVEVVLTQTESEFRAMFDNFMLQLNSTRQDVKQTVNELQENSEAKLNTEQLQYEKSIDDVKQKMTKCKTLLQTSSNVTERFNLIKQLPSVGSDSVQNSNCMENVFKSSEATLNAGKSCVVQWQDTVKDVVSNVATALSQLNLTDVLIQR